MSKNIKSKELEEELKIALNFLKRTTTTIASPTLTPQVIIISNSREEVETLFQPIVEEQSKQTFKPKTCGRNRVATTCEQGQWKRVYSRIF